MKEKISIDSKAPLSSSRAALVKYLKQQDGINHAKIQQSYINEKTNLPIREPLITISKGRPTINDFAFADFLGVKQEEGLAKEFVGKQLDMTFDIHIWNGTAPSMGGEREIERLQERLLRLFAFNDEGIDGIVFSDFEEGTAVEDPFEEDLFHVRCRLYTETILDEEITHEGIGEIFVHGEIKTRR